MPYITQLLPVESINTTIYITFALLLSNTGDVV